jgi:hypothetical protein
MYLLLTVTTCNDTLVYYIYCKLLFLSFFFFFLSPQTEHLALADYSFAVLFSDLIFICFPSFALYN